MSDIWRATPTSPVNISKSFTSQKFAADLKHLKPGKAPGPDSIWPELIIHAGGALKFWLCGFFSFCLRHLHILNVWRRALVVASPKPKKPVEDLKSYCLISLLCVPYKILERLIHARVELIVDPLFLPGWVSTGKVNRGSDCSLRLLTVLLTQNIEDSFEAKKKTGAVLVDLTSAYDTVWHCGLTCKLLRLLPDKHIFFLFAIFILHSRESNVLLCFGW